MNGLRAIEQQLDMCKLVYAMFFHCSSGVDCWSRLRCVAVSVLVSMTEARDVPSLLTRPHIYVAFDRPECEHLSLITHDHVSIFHFLKRSSIKRKLRLRIGVASVNDFPDVVRE